MVEESYYWPKLQHDVAKYVERCRTCKVAKGQANNIGFYTPFSIPKAPWEDVSMYFILGIPQTQ
jgi:hypothetical protein